MSIAERVPEAAAENLPGFRRSSLVSCPQYHPETVRKALRRSLDLVGSFDQCIRPGDVVLLKPNLLSAREPEKAVTTHPEVIAAVAEVLLDCRSKIILADSPGGAAKALPAYWEKTGIRRVADRFGIELVSLENAPIRTFEAPEGFISISRLPLEVDHIINLPKLKTHQLTRMTGAVKNMFGVVPGCRKGELHARAPVPLHFSRFVLAIYRRVIPAWNIMDAVVAMEGNGPSSGSPRHIGALMVSTDALALDGVAAKLIGMETFRLPIFQAAVEAGIWRESGEEIIPLGDDPDDFVVPDFRQPMISRIERIPSVIHQSLKKLIWIRPRADGALCTTCGKCVQNCPVQAMTFKKGVPKINYERCIRCGCCDELCDDRAIYQEMSWLAKFFA